MIEVQDLVKRYGSYLAVDHLSFSAEKGRIYGFLGPNGAGKSTTMNIMTGCLAPTSGTILVDGVDLQDEPEQVKRRIGYLPELPPLYPEMTVREYLTFAAKLKKVPRLRQLQEVVQAMQKTDLTDEQDHLIRTLSKGYRQRVGLAATLLGNPEVIILDEPTVGLDPRQILEIRDLIRSLREDHVVLLSSHILSEVSAVCDYIFILSHGKLVASDTPDNLEAQLHAGGALCASVRATPEQIHALCTEHLPGIPVEVTANTRAGLTDLRLEVADDSVTERLFYACADTGHPILKLEREKASLEEIFLELTDDHAPRVRHPHTDELLQEEAGA